MKQVIVKSSEECKIEEKMKRCPECGTKGTTPENHCFDGEPVYPLYLKCMNELCGCEWRVVEEGEPKLSNKLTVTLPPAPPSPPNRIMGAFGETKESKEARAKYEEDLAEWQKLVNFWKESYGSVYYVRMY